MMERCASANVDMNYDIVTKQQFYDIREGLEHFLASFPNGLVDNCEYAHKDSGKVSILLDHLPNFKKHHTGMD